jgi:membrane protein
MDDFLTWRVPTGHLSVRCRKRLFGFALGRSDAESRGQEHQHHFLPHPSESGFERNSAHWGTVIASGPSSRLHEGSRLRRRIWRTVSRSPFESLWNLQGVPVRVVAIRTWRALLADRVFGQSAELGFYFLFAVFPTLFCASSILGIVAKSAHHIYDQILNYLALVVPAQALKTVLFTFNQTTTAATSSKVTLGSIGTLWAASVGISAMQSSLNAIYKIEDSRSYFVSQLYAIGLTILLAIVISVGLGALFAGSFFAGAVRGYFHVAVLQSAVSVLVRVVAWSVAAVMLSLTFAIIYYWVPGWKTRRWHWLTPGTLAGIIGWLIASLGLRFYLNLFNRFSVVYGSLGAVIILLTWFYISGLMLLLGAEINKEIELAAAERRAKAGSSSMDA